MSCSKILISFITFESPIYYQLHHRLLYIFFLLSVSCSLLAQQQFVFTHLGIKDGLVAENIRAVQQDAKGFIWIASGNGLQRYDGNRFVNIQYSSKKSGSIPKGAIYEICFDNKGRLWMLASGFKCGYLTIPDYIFHEVPVRFPAQLLNKSEGHLQKDYDGNIMLLSVKNGILTYNEATNSFTEASNPFILPAEWKPLSLYQDKQNKNYWIGCDSGLVKYNPLKKLTSFRNHNAEEDPVIDVFKNVTTIIQCYRDKKDWFWLISWPASGVSIRSWDPAIKKTTEWSGDISNSIGNKYYDIRHFREFNDGSFWIGGQNTLSRLDDGRTGFLSVNNNSSNEFSIHFDLIFDLLEDQEKNIWIGTDKGLYRFNPSAQFFKTFTNRKQGVDSIYTPDVTDILQLKGNNNILVSTWGNGIFTYDSAFNTVNKKSSARYFKQENSMAWCLLQRKNEDIWAGLQDGVLMIYNAATKKTERITPSAVGGSTIRQIAEDKAGNIWLGTQSGRLVEWNPGTNTFIIRQELSSTIGRLYIDNINTIWVCTSADGAYRINASDGSIINHYVTGSKDTSLLGIGAADIIQYNDSIYFIASEGLNILNIKKNTFRYITSEQGLPSDDINNLIKDKFGYVWITSNNGLVSYNYAKSILSHFSYESGVLNNSFSVASANILNDGRIAFGTSHEIIAFDPYAADFQVNNQHCPPIEITGLKVMNKPLSVDSLKRLKEIELPYTDNSVVIEFSTLTYLMKFGIKYMMEGLDKDWQGGNMDDEVVYNYLPPGTYTFKIKSESGKDCNSDVTILHIKIRAPFWKTWWFYSLLALVAASVLYWFDKERMNKKEAMQKMRSEIAGNLHNEVNTALSNINILSEMAKLKAEKDPQKSVEYIEQIHTKSHNMIIAMDDMLWGIDPENDTMHKIVLRMKEFTDALNNRYAAEIDMIVDKKVEGLPINMKLRLEAFLLFKEALRSLVNAGVRTCHIHIGPEKGKLSFTIQFNNEGCDLQQLNNFLQRQDMQLRLNSIQAILKTEVSKTISLFQLLVPVN